jgi:hypothetical protein
METKKERRVASAVLPELYEVSDLGRVRRKKVFVDRSRTRIAFDWVSVTDKNGYRTQEHVIALQKMNTGYWRADLRVMVNGKPTRKSVLVHRLVYASFNNLDVKEMLDVGHHDDNPDNNILDNLYETNQNKNVNNKKLAYKLLHLYKSWLITIPEWYDINTEL